MTVSRQPIDVVRPITLECVWVTAHFHVGRSWLVNICERVRAGIRNAKAKGGGLGGAAQGYGGRRQNRRPARPGALVGHDLQGDRLDAGDGTKGALYSLPQIPASSTR